MTDLSIHLLAGLRVVRDGDERPVTSRRQRAVVAALALRSGGTVSSEALIDAVWGDEPPAGARATLQTYISRLRSALGEDVVVHGPAGYRLTEGVTTDVALARRLAADARAALATAPDVAADTARRALALWDGPSLAELAGDPWFVPAATGLEELRANLTDLAAEALLAAGSAHEAIELLEPAARAAPLREPTHVLLIGALHATSRTVEALRVADRYRRHLREETGLDPGAELVGAEQRVLRAEAPADDVRPDDADERGRPPAEHTSREPGAPVAAGVGPVLPRPGRLVGRDGELRALQDALAGSRLVTICGPGGVGKTRIAAELVALRGSSTPAIVVELAPVAPGGVADAVTAALGARGERASLTTIWEHLHDVDGLLVLDNAEHVLAEVRDLVRTLLDRCPRLGVLVTSRSRLDVPDELVVVLPPLPTTGASPAAVELFADRLVRSGRGIDVDGEVDDEVVAVCRRLDGLPLAIELAAGRAAVLGVAGLRERLDRALDLGSGDVDGARHGTLRDVVGWSFDLLDERGRRLAAALSVFEGAFDLDAAERVGEAVLGEPVSLLVGRLVDASIAATTGEPGRYRLLEIVRQFGRERLGSDVGEDEARRAHAAWVAERLDTIARQSVGAGEAGVVDRLSSLRHELRSALRWAVASRDRGVAAAILVPLAGPLLYRPDAELVRTGLEVVHTFAPPIDPRLAAAGARLAFLAGDLAEVDALAAAAIGDGDVRRDADPAAIRRARHACAVGRLYEGRPDLAAELFERIIADPTVSVVDRLDALGGLGLAHCYAGNLDDVEDVIEEHRAIAAAVGSDTYQAFADYMRGEVALARGDVAAAVTSLRAASDRAWSVGATFIWGIAATVLASALVRHGDAAEARDHLRTLLVRWRRTGTWPQLWTSLRLTAELLAEHGRTDVAVLVLTAATRDLAAPALAGEDLARHEALTGRLLDALGTATFSGVAAAASELERVEVLDRALDALDRLGV